VEQVDEQVSTATGALRGNPGAAFEAGLRRMRNQERSRECGFHALECPAQQVGTDCGCGPAPRNRLARRTGPGPLDPGCQHTHTVTSDLITGPCPAEIGARVVHAGYYEWAWADWPHLAGDQLFTWLAVVADPTLEEGLALVTCQWRRLSELRDLSPLTLAKLAGNAAQFVAYARASDCRTLREADDAELARDWVHADIRTGDGYGPAQLPTLHNRRAALRQLYRTARSLGLAAGDPTQDLVLPVRQYNGLRALLDEERPSCRAASIETPWETAQPAAWALAEMGAPTAEIAAFRPCDMRKERHVHLHGGAHTRPRTLEASEWQWEQLTGRVNALRQRADFDPTRPLVYRGDRDGRTDTSPVSAVGQLLRAVLDRAGLYKSDGYTQRSITAWAGRRAYEERQRIEDVANFLGLTSLDRAAQLIGHDWMTDAEAAEDSAPAQDAETAL
jgi:integrase/recombinase XerC